MPEMTISEALAELKRINQLFDQRNQEIMMYCSKRLGAKDTIEKQKDYVKEQSQSARDLIKRYLNIKIAIQKANLETTFQFEDKTYSIAEALIYKQGLFEIYEGLLHAHNINAAQRDIRSYQNVLQANMNVMSKEQLEALNLVPELYYDPKVIQKEKEYYLSLQTYMDALIDKANHNTNIIIAD